MSLLQTTHRPHNQTKCCSTIAGLTAKQALQFTDATLNIYKAVRASPAVACRVAEAWSGDIMGFHNLEPDMGDLGVGGQAVAALSGLLSSSRLSTLLEYVAACHCRKCAISTFHT